MERLDARVAVLTHYLPPYMARVLYYLAQQVSQLDVLLSIDQEPNRQFGNTWDGLNVSVQKSVMLRRPWKHDAGFKEDLYVHFPYDTLSRLRKLDPDIVFSYELGFRSLASAYYCRRERKKLAVCVCVSEHTEQGRGSMRRFLRSRLLRAADAVTYNGPSCLKYLKQFGVPDEKLFHFPYSTSDLFRYSGALQRTRQAGKRLLCVGQLTQRKGVQRLVEALSRYSKSREGQLVELTLVGDGPLKKQLADLPMPTNLQLTLAGHLNYEQLSSLMQSHGVAVFPTLADEWGLVVNEAMQAGMPVLGSCFAQACTTLIVENENGWLYDPNDEKQLFAKLDRIFAVPEEEMLRARSRCVETVAGITSQSSAEQALMALRSI